jgi:hypothetical protein
VTGWVQERPGVQDVQLAQIESGTQQLEKVANTVFMERGGREQPSWRQSAATHVFRNRVYNVGCAEESHLRPYRDEHSASRPIRADKHRRGQRVLTWVTSREHCAAAGFFFPLIFFCFYELLILFLVV